VGSLAVVGINGRLTTHFDTNAPVSGYTSRSYLHSVSVCRGSHLSRWLPSKMHSLCNRCTGPGTGLAWRVTVDVLVLVLVLVLID
jgi:hypothetical protein